MEKGERRIICVEELCSRVVQEGYIDKIIDRIEVMTEDMDLEDKINAAPSLLSLRQIVSKYPSMKWTEAVLKQNLKGWTEMSDLVLLAVEFLRATSPSSDGAEEVPEVEDQIDLQDTFGTNGTSGTIGTIGEEDEEDNDNDIEEEECEDNNSNADTKSFDEDGDGGKDFFHNHHHHASNYGEEDDGDDQYDDSDFEESDGGVEEANNETYNVQQKYANNYRPQTAVTVAVASDDDDEYMEDYEQYNSDEDDKLVLDNSPPQPPPARVSSAPPGNIRGGASPSPPPQPPISERAQTAPPQNSQNGQNNSSNNRLLVPPPKMSQYEPSAGAGSNSGNSGNSSNSGNSNSSSGGGRLGEQKEKVSASRSKENMNPRWVEQGKYKIGNSIGKGQFGEVFQCLNTITGKLYAVKRLLITSKANASAIEQEYKLLVGLEHPNIVTFIGYNLKNEPYCELFQDFVSSGSLQALIDRYGTLDESVVKIYTRQILEGLRYLHSKGIIHRDIKPANILFEKDGVLKLADFGASVQMEDDFNVTAETKTIRGTPYFMAPEVLKENHYGRKGDMWAVGCTIVQMLTGEVPWKRNKVKTLIQLHCLLETLQNGHTPLDYYKGGKCDLSKRERESRLAAEEADALPKKPEMSLELCRILELCFEKDSKKRPFPQELLDDLYFLMVDRDENDESLVASKKDFGEELHEKIDSSHSIFRQNGVQQAPMTGYGKVSSNVPLPIPPPSSSSTEPQPPPMVNTGRRPMAAPPGSTAAELASKKINPFSSKANFKTPSRSSTSGGGSHGGGSSSSSSSSARDDDVSPPIQSYSKSTRDSDEDINVMHGSMEKI